MDSYNEQLNSYDEKKAESKKNGGIIGFSIGGWLLMALLYYLSKMLLNKSSSVDSDIILEKSMTLKSELQKKALRYLLAAVAFFIVAIVGPSLMWALGAVGAKEKHENFQKDRNLFIADNKIKVLAHQALTEPRQETSGTPPAQYEVEADILYYTQYERTLADSFDVKKADDIRIRRIINFVFGGFGTMLGSFVLFAITYGALQDQSSTILNVLALVFLILVFVSPGVMWGIGAGKAHEPYDDVKQKRQEFIDQNQGRINEVEQRARTYPELYAA